LMNNGYTSAATSNRFSTVTSADTTPPTVSITSPASGATYTTVQTVTLTATASDNVGVARVEFYDGGVLKGTDTTAPYTYPWAFAQADDGTHTWTAKAYDAAANTATSAAVLLYVNIVPSTNWVRQFGGPNAGDVAIGRASALDPFGNVVLAATQIGTGNYGGTSVTGTSSLDLPVVAKYSASGQLLWVRMFVRTTGSQGIATAVTTDIDGDGLIAGWL